MFIKINSQVTPSCPIDRLEFTNIYHRDHLAASESGHKPIPKKVAKTESDDTIVIIDEPETSCEVCRRGDREHLLLLCDGCDLGYHTTCLVPVLAEVPRGQWFCPTCAGQGVGGEENQTVTRSLPEGRQAHVARSRTARSGSRRLRSGGNLITRTGQVLDIFHT